MDRAKHVLSEDRSDIPFAAVFRRLLMFFFSSTFDGRGLLYAEKRLSRYLAED